MFLFILIVMSPSLDDETFERNVRLWRREWDYSSQLTAEKIIARHLFHELGDYYANIRIAEIRDTYTALGEDVGPVYYLERNGLAGYALTNGGEGPVYYFHGINLLRNSSDVEHGTLRSTPYPSVIEEWIPPFLLQLVGKEPLAKNPGELLVECRPQKIIVRKDDPTLVDICQGLMEPLSHDVIVIPGQIFDELSRT
jgi:hypothetical protein